MAEKREEVKTLKDQLRSEAAEMVTRRRRLDLVMAENQATVIAISERLAKSDTEVERLESELEWERTRLREHRDLLNTMRTNSNLAHDQMRTLLQQLDAKKEDIDQLVVDNVVKFDAMKTFFDGKIQELNDVAAAEITRLQAAYDKSNNYNKEVRWRIKILRLLKRRSDVESSATVLNISLSSSVSLAETTAQRNVRQTERSSENVTQSRGAIRRPNNESCSA